MQFVWNIFIFSLLFSFPFINFCFVLIKPVAMQHQFKYFFSRWPRNERFERLWHCECGQTCEMFHV